MAIANKDEVEGQWEQTKGTIKEGFGKLVGDDQTAAEGEAQQVGGEAQEGWGKLKRGVGEVVEDIGNAVSGTGDKINK